MSEQQRLVLAIGLCLGILLAWQYFFPPPEPPPPGAPTPHGTTAEQGTPEAPPSAPAVPATGAQQIAPGAPTEVPEARRTFATPRFKGEIVNRGAALTALSLEGYREPRYLSEAERAQRKEDTKVDEQPVSLVTAPTPGGARQALVTFRLGESATTPPLSFAPEGEGLVLSGADASGLKVSVRLTPRADAWAIDYVLRVENGSEQAQTAGAQVTLGLEHRGSEASMFAPASDMVHGLCWVEQAVERRNLQDLEEGPYVPDTPAAWGAIDRQYFVVGLVPEDGHGKCSMRAEKRTLWVDYALEGAQLAPGAVWEKKFALYAGPKRTGDLRAVAAPLTETIEYDLWGIPLGFIARPMVFLLNLFHGWTGSWGFAIACLTLLVKILILPLTYRQSISMRRMMLLKPDMDRIKKQFDGDQQRIQLETMKLYREKNVNPLGGCLPILVQWPIGLALYRSLWSAVELYHQPFLWISDLTAPEPLPFMAVTLGAVTYLQQKLTPTTVDNAQMKVMLYMMPIMFTAFMIPLPAGLVWYILVNSLLTIVQQLVINRQKVTL